MDEARSPEVLDPLDRLAGEFVSAWRHGEQPSVEAYAEIHPDLSREIRSLFPVLRLLEQSKASGSSDERAERGTQAPMAGLVPDHLGGYRLIHELGRGGMGTVFEAWQESLGRRVAIKVLPTSMLQDDRGRQRFLREAKAIARLHHPHIASIHEVGEEAGVLYYVMDLVDGTSLDQLVTQERISATGGERACWVARMGLQAARVLAYAHDEGVLHRDVKPANLLLDQDGVLWLTDFGLAKLIDETALTATGEWLGTLRYLAPECLRGETSVRSDIYSLGLTLYELLVGAPAFPETDRPVLIRHILDSVPAPPRKCDPTIPADLETIVLKASAQEPNDRYATGGELAEDLERFLDGRAIMGCRPGPIRRLARSVRRHPALAVLSTTTIILAVSMTILFGLYLSHSPRSTVQTEPPNPPAVVPANPEPGRTGPPWGPGLRHQPAGVGRGRRGPWRDSTP
jgi:eukaryotic-like serine/threonine-protein kinase